MDGSLVPSRSFLTSRLRPRILQFLSLTLKSSQCHRLVTSSEMADELLLCPIRALRKYLSRMEQYHPGIECLFISAGWRKKRVSRNTISFWLRSVISMTHASPSEEDCRSLRVRTHEVRKVATSLLFKRNCEVIRY